MKLLPRYFPNTKCYKPARVSRYKFMLIVASLFQIAIAGVAHARLTPGDVLVLDIGIGGDVGPEIVFRVDPTTGSRTIFRNLRDIDPTDQLRETNGLAVEQSGNVLITDSRLGPDDVPALYRLDVATGDRTLLTVFDFVGPDGKRRASGTIDLAVENSGSVLVLVGTLVERDTNPRGPFAGPSIVSGPSILYRVDPVTGKPTSLTDFAQLSGRDPLAGPTVVGRAVALEPSGTPVVAVDVQNPNPGTQLLYRLNRTDGSPTLIATVPIDSDSGFPPTISDIEVETSGAILAVAYDAGPNGNGKLYRVNQRTGAFSVLTDFGAGPFETLGFSPVDIALEASGKILVADMDAGVPFNEHGSVWRIDPRSGARSVLSNFGQNANQGLNPYAVAVVPAAFVEFREFVPMLDIDVRHGHNDRFDLEAEITLGDNSDGILPPKEIVTLRIGSYSATLPSGSFKKKKYGSKLFRFHGKVNGVALDVTLQRGKAKDYKLMAFGRGAKLRGIENPVPVTLTIGNDRGNTSVEARIMP